MFTPTHLPSSLIGRICHKYGLKYQQFLTSQAGYRNRIYPVILIDGSLVNVTLYKAEPGITQRINNANTTSDFLATKGFPTRRTLGKVLQLRTPSRIRYAALYSYLPGATIPWDAYTKHHIKLLGKTLSDMHATLQEMPNNTDLPEVASEYDKVTKRTQRYFADQYVQHAMVEKIQLQVDEATLSECRNTLLLGTRLPGQHALHMDFVRGNILFDSNQNGLLISGILDFEKASYGSPLFDIARTLAFLLVDCKNKPEAKIRKYFLKSGYHKRGKALLKLITVNGRDVLEELVSLFLLHDFYKFLKHNPYESLQYNEHFVRTRDILLRRGLLNKCKMI